MAADLDFFFDPVCPWAWITSRWVTNVAEQRHYTVDWRFISLWVVNEGNTKEWYTPQYREGHFIGHQALRIADEIRITRPNDTDAVGRWYTAVGTALHIDARRAEAGDDLRAFYERLLDSSGFDPSLVDAASDDSHDDHIRAETELALTRTGRDVGTPILTFHPGEPTESSYFGPVIAKAPKGQDALKLWDAVETMATMSGMAELKRSLRDAPDFT
jgi:2-hydroxychromene-2-carboxylate isomerase